MLPPPPSLASFTTQFVRAWVWGEPGSKAWYFTRNHVFLQVAAELQERPRPSDTPQVGTDVSTGGGGGGGGGVASVRRERGCLLAISQSGPPHGAVVSGIQLAIGDKRVVSKLSLHVDAHEIVLA